MLFRSWVWAGPARNEPGEMLPSEYAKFFIEQTADTVARAWAARALGQLGDPAGCKALRRAVASEAVRDQSRVAVEAARSLALLQDAAGGDALERAVTKWVSFYESKLSSGKIRYEDWARVVPTLAALVDAWGRLPGEGDARALEKTVVARVFEPEIGRASCRERV